METATEKKPRKIIPIILAVIYGGMGLTLLILAASDKPSYATMLAYVIFFHIAIIIVAVIFFVVRQFTKHGSILGRIFNVFPTTSLPFLTYGFYYLNPYITPFFTELKGDETSIWMAVKSEWLKDFMLLSWYDPKVGIWNWGNEIWGLSLTLWVVVIGIICLGVEVIKAVRLKTAELDMVLSITFSLLTTIPVVRGIAPPGPYLVLWFLSYLDAITGPVLIIAVLRQRGHWTTSPH